MNCDFEIEWLREQIAANFREDLRSARNVGLCLELVERAQLAYVRRNSNVAPREGNVQNDEAQVTINTAALTHQDLEVALQDLQQKYA